MRHAFCLRQICLHRESTGRRTNGLGLPRQCAGNLGRGALADHEGDAPLAERRAGALALDRDLLRELLGQEELRELLDGDALAEAIGRHMDTTLVHLPVAGLRAILDADPILWRDIALLMCARQGDSLRLLNDQQLGSLDQRMAWTLADLARIHGIAGEQGTDVGLRLPQEQLGAMLGVTRQSVNKLLRGFEEAGLIAIDYNRITIRDPAALDRLAAQRD